MFRNLVSNLPFNPSLLGNLAFYAQRVKEEQALRRAGFLFVALAMFIQMFAVMAPPEKSLAYSANNIINGVKTRDDLLRAWDGKTSDKNVAAIYTRFGITRNDIAALPLHPNTTISTKNVDYWSIGRQSLSASSRADKIHPWHKIGEIPVSHSGGKIYLRKLRAWDIKNPHNSYKAFQGTSNGKKFWIIVDCGNLTFSEKPPLEKPRLELRKSIDGGPRNLKPGDQFTFRFEYRNPVPDSSPVSNAVLYDNLDLAKFDIVKPKNLPLSGNKLSYQIGDVPYSQNFNTALTITVKLKSNLANGAKACNAATLKGSGVPDVTSGGNNLCITVVNPCPLDSSLSKTDERCTKPVVACIVTNSAVDRTTKSFTLKTVVNSSNPKLTSIQSYVYDFGDGSPVNTKRSSSYEDIATHSYSDGNYTATVVVNYKVGSGASQTDQTVSCSGQIDSEPDQPLSQEKTARNLTQNLDENATPDTKAKAGDTIEYSLITNNSYGYDRNNVNTSDYIGDLLDYAELDRSFLASQNGTFDEESKTLSWQGQSVKADSSITNKFRIKLKNPVPSTNQPNAMSTSYDCQLNNKFGNQLDIEVDCPLPKSAEYITERLPNTGPGSSLILGFTATTIITYFFARSWLLNKELEIIRTDFAQSGGM